MKLQTFYEKFELITDAPNAVAKMRELVLNLAVQGKLVANTAENLLSVKQIALDKQQRLRELNLRSHPETPQPNENDFPFSLPKSWNAVSLGDLAYSCPTSYGEDPIPSLPKAGVVKVGNIDNKGGFKGQFSERGFPADEIESLLARRGDLMVVKSSGSAENVHSGKTALCTAEHDGKIVGTNFVLRLRLLGTPALPEYIWRVLTSRYSRAWIEGTVQTMTYPNLKWSEFARLPIPLPPLAEQKRIVAKVDELMVLCDQLEAQQQERETRHAALARASLARFADVPTPANLEFLFHKSYTITPADLRKSILTFAVQGKLVPQNPSDEPSEVLIKKISAEQERLVKAHQIRLLKTAPMIEDDEPFAIPMSWTWTRLGQIGDWGSGSTPPRGNHELYGGSIPWLKSGELNDNRTLAGSVETVTELAVKSCSFRMNKPGDVLLAMYGATIGKAAILAKAAVTNQAVCGCTPFTGVLNTYLFEYLLSQRDAFHAASEGGAQPNISKVKIVGYPFPLPPLAEQRRIVTKVDQLMALVDELEMQLIASEATSKKLLEAVVYELASAA